MSRVINTWRDPYDQGFSICRPKQITIQPGLTVLVGCNGAGKTTLLNNIQSELKKARVPYYTFNNLHDGGSNARGAALYREDFSFMATASMSSEGENICMNIGRVVSKLKEFMQTGRVADRMTSLVDALSGEEYQIPETKERWFLLDAVDSGYSIDNVVDLKEFFDLVIKDFAGHGYELYIIVSANEYELAHNTPCLDVTNGKYMEFNQYDEFKKFILKSREKKDKRDERAAERERAEEENN